MPATEWGEDCLNANIYRPKGSEGKKLPVAAYIHGGAFNGGKGMFCCCYNSTVRAAI